jgi:cobaltochelatase CobS
MEQNMTNTIHDELEKLQAVELDAGTVFSGSSSGRIIRGYASPCSYTPTPDPGYIFHETSRDIAVWLMNISDPLYVFGPTGSGKTSAIKQLASRLNYPVFEVTGHSRLEFPDLVGHLSVRNGSMEFEYGPLALAMKYGGLMLLNEIDLLEPATATGLNGVLDGEALCIAENGGELIIPHPMFRFAATANTNGGSDETGLYQGTLRQNLAFLDRFWLCEMGYPARDAEEKLLGGCCPKLPETIRKKMVEYANEVRRLFMGEAGVGIANSIEVTFSTRTLLRWADLTVRFQPLSRQGVQPVTYALDRALGFRATRETRAMLHELAQRVFPQSMGE